MDQKQINDLLTKMTLEEKISQLRLPQIFMKAQKIKVKLQALWRKWELPERWSGPAARYSVFQGRFDHSITAGLYEKAVSGYRSCSWRM